VVRLGRGTRPADVGVVRLTSAVRGEWWSRSACSSADPELFFPIASVGPAVSQIAKAKAICAACRVRSQCLSYALEADPLHGIWGGTTEQERLTLRKSVRRYRKLTRDQASAGRRAGSPATRARRT
jgi:WhiB family transcriptional regulator, redox-sensing transcriptional regulator